MMQHFIDTFPHRFRRAMVAHHITRLVKRESGDPTFETIDRETDVIKLAGRHAPLDVVTEFGVDAARDEALDNTTRLAIGSGFDALRDAGIPLVMRYKTTTLHTRLPDRWGLPEAMRDDTGVVFASAFPGYDNFAADLERYATDRGRREQLLALEAVRSRMRGDEPAAAEVDRRIADLRRLLAAEPFTFDRRFLFRVLSMGHSQFAEIIGARGPNTQVNAACASTTQAICVAEDWIRAGRCRRVIVVSDDDATSDSLLRCFGAAADSVVITNTKGFTGHAMGAGIEDVVGIKALETGVVPPVPNYKEPDPELGALNLSKGGAYPVRYALRLAAGFGSQIAMALLRWTPVPDGRHRAPDELGYRYRVVDPATWQRWLDSMSGTAGARLEVVQRRLRVVDTAAATVEPSPAPEPVVVAPEPVVVTPAPESIAAPADDITPAVVEIVSGLTGYPPELLDVDLDMEADLGVDTVKQAEVFAAVRERFNVPRDDNLKLRDFPTLTHVIGWIRGKTAKPEPAGAPAEAPAPADEITPAVVEIVSGL